MRLFAPLQILLPSLILCFGFTLGNQKLIYQGSLEGIKTTWTIEQNTDKIAIEGQSKGNDIKLEYSPSFSLLHYFELEPNSKPLEITRKDNQLLVQNKDLSKSLLLGKLPWVQDFKFGLRPFLQEKAKEFSFSIFYAKECSLHDMIATKEIEETIDIDGQKYETQKVKITLKGFKKRFWKAEVWFDKKTHLMIRYRSNEGPGTPHNTVNLISS